MSLVFIVRLSYFSAGIVRPLNYVNEPRRVEGTTMSDDSFIGLLLKDRIYSWFWNIKQEIFFTDDM